MVFREAITEPMNTDDLLTTFEQNHHNLQLLAEEFGVAHRLDEEPEKARQKAQLFGVSKATDTSEKSEEERLGWLIRQNAQAIVEIAAAAGVSEPKIEGEATSAASKYADLFVPSSQRGDDSGATAEGRTLEEQKRAIFLPGGD